ncbi:response regulator transcription factor [Jidongwangia harbinensis]|uniref:response regulator transcription factor n=1 Tax=Jidongwangia harbinensis TaxID=2878561 RepID=UPI001CD957E1|nr:helix-turn-helix domain-containing protein [Jidongwangia harbinensis]MCA2217399.1 helix-turn-helix domain-containing protein [Jidongwangia harbinensis]
MKPLPVRAYEQILDLVTAALDDELPGPPWPVLARAVRDAIGGTAVVMVTGGSPDAGGGPVLAWTRSPLLIKANERVRTFRPTHPLTPVFAAGERAPTRVSDVIGSAAWRRNSNYDLARREVDGSTHHLGIPVSPTRTALIVRSTMDFRGRDLDVAHRLVPLLNRLDRHLTELHGLRAALTPERPTGRPRVTPRELTILGLMAQGLTAAAIGRRLGIRPATVTKHQENLYRKLDTHDRLTTVLYAQRCGILPMRR